MVYQSTGGAGGAWTRLNPCSAHPWTHTQPGTLPGCCREQRDLSPPRAGQQSSNLSLSPISCCKQGSGSPAGTSGSFLTLHQAPRCAATASLLPRVLQPWIKLQGQQIPGQSRLQGMHLPPTPTGLQGALKTPNPSRFHSTISSQLKAPKHAFNLSLIKLLLSTH